MKSQDIPYNKDPHKKDWLLSDLLERAEQEKRVNWQDIFNGSGIYIIYKPDYFDLIFSKNSGKAIYTDTVSPELLLKKWESTTFRETTDILYIGKGVSIRKRIRLLIRFGIGKARNHGGGEWIWQISNIRNCRILISSCPMTKENAYEKWLLDSFRSQHGDWPLANRKGGDGIDVWFPNKAI